MRKNNFLQSWKKRLRNVLRLSFPYFSFLSIHSMCLILIIILSTDKKWKKEMHHPDKKKTVYFGCGFERTEHSDEWKIPQFFNIILQGKRKVRSIFMKNVGAIIIRKEKEIVVWWLHRLKMNDEGKEWEGLTRRWTDYVV